MPTSSDIGSTVSAVSAGEPLEVHYPDLVAFLRDAERYLSQETICLRAAPRLEAGARVLVRIALPVLDAWVECLAKAGAGGPEGVVCDVLEWSEGDRKRLWRYVALSWAMLRAAGHPKFQGAPPAPAARQDVRTIVALEPIYLGESPLPGRSGQGGTAPGGAGPERGDNGRGPGDPARTSGRFDVIGGGGTGATVRTTGGGPAVPGVAATAGHGGASVRTTGNGASIPGSVRPSGLEELRTENVAKRSGAYPSLGTTGSAQRTPVTGETPIGAAPGGVDAGRSMSLSSRSLAHVLCQLLIEHRSGWLEVTSGGQSNRIRLEAGQVVQLEQRPHADIRLFSTALTGVGLKWPEFQQYELELAHSDEPELFLLAVRRLSPELAARVLSRRLSLQLHRALEQGWSGEARFVPLQADRGTSLRPAPPVPLARMIWDALRARAFSAAPRPRELLEPLLSRPLVWSRAGRFPIQDALPRPEEGAIIQRCRDDLQGMLLELREPGREDIVSLVTGWCLLQVGLIEPVGIEAPVTRDEGALLSELARKESSMAQQNHFEVLELHWSAHPGEIKPAFDRLLAHYRPHTESGNPRIARASQAVLRRLLEAFNVLGSEESRREYRRKTFGADLMTAVRLAMEQGELLELRGEKLDALRCFEQAFDLAPNDVEVWDRLQLQRRVMGINVSAAS